YYFDTQDAYGNSVNPCAQITEISGVTVYTNPQLLDGTATYNSLTDKVFVNVTYRNADGIDVKQDSVKLHIYDGTTEVQSSPFAMNYIGGVELTGKIFRTTVTIPSGNDYSYKFETQDINGWVKIETDLENGLIVNRAPELLWLETNEYLNKGVDKEECYESQDIVFKIKYKDTEGESPKQGYPKVIINNNDYEMEQLEGDFYTGMVYEYRTKLQKGIYEYRFSVQDSYGNNVNPCEQIENKIGVCVYADPTLDWLGTGEYTDKGVFYDVANDEVVYRIKYEAENEAQPYETYPKVHIYRGFTEIETGIMTYISGWIPNGAEYEYRTKLESGMIYRYSFEVKDENEWLTINTDLNNGPIVNKVPTLSWLETGEYIGRGINCLEGFESNNYTFKVKYEDTEGDAPNYVKLHLKKDGEIVNGSPFTMTNEGSGIYEKTLSNIESGTYSYYFNAQDSYGNNVNSCTQTTEQGGMIVYRNPSLMEGQAVYNSLTNKVKFEVKYESLDQIKVSAERIKVKIYDGTSEIAQSPILLEYENGTLMTSEKYSKEVELVSGENYSYKFEAQDINGWINLEKNLITGLVVNKAPTLSWLETDEYVGRGIDRLEGFQSNNYTFKVKYEDTEGDTPNYIKVHIKKDGAEVSGSPFDMKDEGSRVYAVSLNNLEKGAYTYWFDAKDDYGNNVNPCTQTAEQTGLIVSSLPRLDSETSIYNSTTDIVIVNVTYTNVDSVEAKQDSVKLHIYNGTTEIADSPFVMSYVSGQIKTGNIYRKELTLSSGNNYFYKIKAQDENEWTTLQTNLTNLAVVNKAPTLSWIETGEYIDRGINRLEGFESNNYTFKVKYEDTEGDTPNYVKVYVKKDGAEISDSPFDMTHEGNGIYALSLSNLRKGTYEYWFDARDSYGNSVNPCDQTSKNSGITVYSSPTLDSETSSYNSITDKVTINVIYTNADGIDVKQDSVKLHIYDGTTEMQGSPFVMNYVSGQVVTGNRYKKELILPSGDNYFYRIKAEDVNSWSKIETNINSIVINKAPTLSWLETSEYIGRGINRLEGFESNKYTFKIKYEDTEGNAPNYVKVYVKKNGAEISDSPFDMTHEGSGIYVKTLANIESGNYSYWFNAQDSYGNNVNSCTQTTKQTGVNVYNNPTLDSETSSYNSTTDKITV
ncbi:hypothetical protein ACFL4A_04765, partial [bacterium]